MTSEEMAKELEKITSEVSNKDFWGTYLACFIDVMNENKKLKQEVKNCNKGIQELIIGRSRWKNKYYNSKSRVKELKQEKENLINYLENELKEIRHQAQIELNFPNPNKRLQYLNGKINTIKEILKKVKEGKYE